ncbi:unnamed protein product [Leptosia nina]|uniref:Uncharacterized protein n=1 Tax=Leptosia nina TaxID=320188 RepID=A0AAV1K0J6_9NEOP
MRPRRAMTAPGSLPLREARAVVLQPSHLPPPPLFLLLGPRLRRALFDPQSVRKIKYAAFRDRSPVSIAIGRRAHLPSRSAAVACIASVVWSPKGGRNARISRFAEYLLDQVLEPLT